ncbi:flagellar biosynthetic protein FliO [Pollutimonas sp. H1-120]|uniref:flagellar biosynthetic protein FliO n=1 Tax=Pollutimonas sp. H1-120 TaxID=3148824 RepID=UPI003B52400F
MSEAAVLRLVISLVFIVALILACAWMTRRAGWLRGMGSQQLKVLSTQSLGARAYITMVEVEDARLVLGVTANQISLLHTLPPSESTGAETPVRPDPPTFASALGKVLRGR